MTRPRPLVSLWLLALLGCPGTEPLPDPPQVDDLSEHIDARALQPHLLTLESIAQENEGHRALGSPGYDASVDHVAVTLAAAGYEVWTEPFPIVGWSTEDATLAADGLAPLVFEDDFRAFRFSGLGSVEGPLVAIAPTLPPTEEPSADSGCRSAHWEDFPQGGVALIQRGACPYQDKFDAAVDAGAAAVIVFNEGQEGRRGLENITLADEGPASIPALFATFEAGEALIAAAAAGARATLAVEGEVTTTETVNVLAERPVGRDDRVVLVGAHLDSVPAGPGVNDNGSGVALLLALAEAASDFEATNRIRFAFWGAEEIGLRGSRFHLEEGEGQPDALLAYLNFDMVASPNAATFISDSDGSIGDEFDAPEGAGWIEGLFKAWFEQREQPYVQRRMAYRSDHAPFVWAGVPVGGLFTGAGELKTRNEEELFGGAAFTAYDPCYHQACDDADNIWLDQMVTLATAAADVLGALAQRDTPLADAAGARVAPLPPLPPRTIRGCHDHDHVEDH